MPEEKPAKTAETKKADAKHDKKPKPVVAREEAVAKWTLAKCQRAARRFQTQDDWMKGAPSSFKSARDRGWVDQCTGHMTGASKPKVTRKSGGTKRPGYKKSA